MAEVEINNLFLRNNVNILLPPDCSSDELSDILTKNLESSLPFILYSICSDVLSDTVCLFDIFILAAITFKIF